MILLQTCIPSLECEQTIFETLLQVVLLVSDLNEAVSEEVVQLNVRLENVKKRMQELEVQALHTHSLGSRDSEDQDSVEFQLRSEFSDVDSRFIHTTLIYFCFFSALQDQSCYDFVLCSLRLLVSDSFI